MKLSRAVPILTVDDIAAATTAYRQTLGLEVLMDHGWIVTLGSGDVAQFSLMTEDATASCNPVASLQVEDVDAAHAAAEAAGLEIVHALSDEEWGVRRFFFRDPAGNVVNVLKHR
ncbi:VOC family protein [Gordonia sp. NPDC003422]